MIRVKKAFATAVIGAIVLAGCGGDDDGTPDSGSPSSAAPETEAPGAEAPGSTADGPSDSTGGVDTTTASGDDVVYDTDAVLRVGQAATPPQLDPLKGTSPTVDFAYIGQFYDRLIELNSDGTLAPMLATEWELVDDNLGLQVALRDDVTFHDGTPFDADAVVANIERVLAASDTIARGQIAEVASIEKIDDATVKFVTSSDATMLPYSLASYIESGAMVSPAALGDPDSLATMPSGSGPFVLDSIGQDRIVLERAESYWDADLFAKAPAGIEIIGIPDDNARLNALRSGQIDVMAVAATIPDLDSIAQQDDLTLTRFEATQRNILTWLHIGRPPLDDVRVRRAISHAIDRGAIAELSGNTCTAAVQPFGPGTVGYDPELAEILDGWYDPELAKQLLDEAGVANLDLRLVTNQAAINNDISVAMQAMMSAIGINLEINTLPSNETAAAWRGGDYDWYQAYNNGAPDPAMVLAEQYLGRNSPGGAPQEFIDMVDAARVLPIGSDERNAAFQEIGAYLVEDPTHITSCSYPMVYLSRSNIVGVERDSLGPVQIQIDTRHIAVVAS